MIDYVNPHAVIRNYHKSGDNIELYSAQGNRWVAVPPISSYSEGNSPKYNVAHSFRLSDRPWVLSPGNSDRTLRAHPDSFSNYKTSVVPPDKALEELKLYYLMGGEVQCCSDYWGCRVWGTVPKGVSPENWPENIEYRAAGLGKTFFYSPPTLETVKVNANAEGVQPPLSPQLQLDL